MGNDIIDRAEAEEELRKALQVAEASKAQYELIVSMISDIIWRYDVNAQGEHIGSYISPAADRMLSLPNGTIGNSFERYLSYVHPDDLQSVKEIFSEEIRALGMHKTAEYRLRKANGTTLWVSSKFSAFDRFSVFGTTSDITERKQAEEAIGESHKRLTDILDSLDSLVYVADFNSYELLFINKYGREIWGDVQRRKCWQVFQKGQKGPCSFCTNDKLVSDAGISTGVCQWEFQNTANGRWYECRDQAIPWTGKTLVRMEIATDITMRKQMELARQESEERLREVLENSLDASYKRNLQTNAYDYLSPVFARISGYTSDEMKTLPIETVLGLIHPDDKDEIEHKMGESVSGAPGATYQVEYRFKHKDGRYRWFRDQFTSLRDANGHPLALIGSVSDITERKKVEEALKESEEKYRLLINNASESIIVAQDGLLKFVNPMTLDLLRGYSEQELIDRPFPQIIHPDDRSMVVENYRRRTANEAALSRYAFRVVTRDGTIKWVEINVALIERQGKPATLNFLTDITERKRAEQELQQTNQNLKIAIEKSNEMAEQAKKANVAKSEFLANMSHEIRTPLNGVIGMTGLLQDMDLNAEQQEYAEIAHISGEMLLSLINDILDFSKIEARKLELETLDFDLGSMLKDTADLLAIGAHEKGLTLVCLVEPAVPSLLRGDPGRLRQILVNLEVMP